MRIYRYPFLCPILAMLIIASPCSAWETKEELEALKSSPYCTTLTPKGFDPDFYLWPKSSIDAYHGNPGVYYQKGMFSCRGNTQETNQVIHVWPSWRYHIREDWWYPLTVVDTAGGILAVRGRELVDTLFLDGKPFVEGFTGTIDEAYPEEEGGCEIVIVSRDEANGYLRHIIDFGVSPPFISPVNLEIGTYETVFFSVRDAYSPPESRIKIKKIGTDVYEFSGPAWSESGTPTEIVYRYSRKTRTVTKVE